MKTTFTSTSEYKNKETIEVTTDAIVLTDILESFEKFLRGSGFVFDGHIDIVEED